MENVSSLRHKMCAWVFFFFNYSWFVWLFSPSVFVGRSRHLVRYLSFTSLTGLWQTTAGNRPIIFFTLMAMVVCSKRLKGLSNFMVIVAITLLPSFLKEWVKKISAGWIPCVSRQRNTGTRVKATKVPTDSGKRCPLQGIDLWSGLSTVQRTKNASGWSFHQNHTCKLI